MAAVEKIEEKRKPEDFFGHRKRTPALAKRPSVDVKERIATRRCGGTGRHKGLKIPRRKKRTGSIPVTGTISPIFERK